MTIKELISQGEQMKARNSKGSAYNESYITGEEYETWIAKCIIYFENNFEKCSPTLVERFKEASKDAVGNGVEYYNTMIGILKAFDEMEVI